MEKPEEEKPKLMLCNASIEDIVRELDMRKINYIFACGNKPFQIEVDYGGKHGVKMLQSLSSYVAFIEAQRYVQAYGATLIRNTHKETV